MRIMRWLSFLYVWLLSWSVVQAAEPIAIIVNATLPIEELRSTVLAKIYKGEQEHWPDGKPITVLNRPIESEIRRQFYDIVLKADPTTKFFVPGSPIPVKTMIVQSDLATRKMVASIPNAIGYIPLSSADPTVKILKINEVLPGNAAYELQEK